MGYTHGEKWTDKKIENAIREVMKKTQTNSLPTHAQMNEITGNMCLSNAVSRNGGSIYWANRLGLEIKPCESKLGHEYECLCLSKLNNLGYDCELTKARYPYDLIANGNIKIDVKCSNLYKCSNGNFYTFNLEKSMPTCDIFICYCLNNENIQKIYIIPSCVVTGKTQLSIGGQHSKYNKYIDAWHYLKKYDDFYKTIVS